MWRCQAVGKWTEGFHPSTWGRPGVRLHIHLFTQNPKEKALNSYYCEVERKEDASMIVRLSSEFLNLTLRLYFTFFKVIKLHF